MVRTPRTTRRRDARTTRIDRWTGPSSSCTNHAGTTVGEVADTDHEHARLVGQHLAQQLRAHVAEANLGAHVEPVLGERTGARVEQLPHRVRAVRLGHVRRTDRQVDRLGGNVAQQARSHRERAAPACLASGAKITTRSGTSAAPGRHSRCCAPCSRCHCTACALPGPVASTGIPGGAAEPRSSRTLSRVCMREASVPSNGDSRSAWACSDRPPPP